MKKTQGTILGVGGREGRGGGVGFDQACADSVASLDHKSLSFLGG